MQKLLRPTDELLCASPAVHRTAEGHCFVWLGVGKSRLREDFVVFVFSVPYLFGPNEREAWGGEAWGGESRWARIEPAACQ